MKRILLSKGFTLIELIVAFSIIAILSTVGIASFVTYSRQSSVDTDRDNLRNVLNLAKAKAQSQVNICTSGTLSGYQVGVSNTTTYYLKVICVNGSGPSQTNYHTSSANVTLSTTGSSTYTFQVLSGGVTNSGTITVSGSLGWGTTARTISIGTDGSIN